MSGKPSSSTPSASVASWHQSTSEKRPMKRHSRLGNPDIHPQDPKQEEDQLPVNRLNKGYQVATSSFEHESLVMGSKSARLDRLDDAQSKSGTVLSSLLHKKADSSSLEKDRRRMTKEEKNRDYEKLPPNREKIQWFSDLAKGVKWQTLAKRIPTGLRKEEILEALYEFKISGYKATWVLKLAATTSSSPVKASKKMNPTFSLMDPSEYAKEFSMQLVQILRQIMRKVWDVEDLMQETFYKDRWAFFTQLSKTSFDEGVLGRQEFLNELCELFTDFFLRRMDNEVPLGEERLPQLRVFLLFFSQFVKSLGLNLLLARRTAFIICIKLNMIKDVYDNQIGIVSNGAEAYQAMTRCMEWRSIIEVLSALLQTVVIHTPAALIWNKFRVDFNRTPFMLHQLCGSPLDLLPCNVQELPTPGSKDSDNFVELLKLKHEEIIRRSQAVHDEWSPHHKERLGYALLIDKAMRVIGLLDSANYMEANIIESLTSAIFNCREDVAFNDQVVFRLKLILEWAVTHEREGTYRATVIAKIIHNFVSVQRSTIFGKYNLQSLILNFFEVEGPKVDHKFYGVQFGAMVTLFMELGKRKLFIHDDFVKNLIRTGEFDYLRPIYRNFIKFEEPKLDLDRHQHPGYSVPIKTEVDDGFHMGRTPKVEPLSFLPPTPHSLCTPLEEDDDRHTLLTEKMTANERILVQMPIRQVEQFRDEANQRDKVLYGMGDERELHTNQLKTIAKEICKIWQKKINAQFSDTNKEVVCLYFRRISTVKPKIKEIMSKYSALTYYDQVVVCGWCAESYSDMIRDFITGNGSKMPTSEGLDIICGMFEQSYDIAGIFELCHSMSPMFPAVEKRVRSMASDVLPGSVAGPLAYVLIGYLSKHFVAFLHSEHAPHILNSLFPLVEPMLRCQDYPKNAWYRMVAMFCFHSKKILVKSQFTTVPLFPLRKLDFVPIFHAIKPAQVTNCKQYNSLFFKDILIDKQPFFSRFYSYHEYKKRLPSFQQRHNRYSFIINACIAAEACGKRKENFEMLSELATFCSHITAEVPALAEEWIVAAKAICSNFTLQYGFLEMKSLLHVSDCESHYALSTFFMLLVSKYAICLPRLIAELASFIFQLAISKNQLTNENEPGICIALLIVTKIFCRTDRPFQFSDHYTGGLVSPPVYRETADLHALAMYHWHELDQTFYQTISNMTIMLDSQKSRHKDLELELLPPVAETTMYRREYLLNVLKACIVAINEQEWITYKIFNVVESNKLEPFITPLLRQNGMGQQLLRLGTRRRAERTVAQQLTICNGNSKKALIDQLLTSLSVWNLRSALFDIRLMIKEISPEGQQRHAQQVAIQADALVGEIGKCCRDLFTSAYKDGIQLRGPPLDPNVQFEVSTVSKYWLMAPLIKFCAQTINLSSSFSSASVAGKFLKEVAGLLDITDNASSLEKIEQSSWLLIQQPFFNLVTTCMKCETMAEHRDVLINALFKQMQTLTMFIKENPGRLITEKFYLYREALLLRLTLVGCIFNQVCEASGQCEAWSVLLFQMMLFGVIDSDRDRKFFDSCYDMLSTMLLHTITDTSYMEPTKSADDKTDKKTATYKWSTYALVVKKMKKEIDDCPGAPELRKLMQFIPLQRSTIDILTTDNYGTIIANALTTGKVVKNSGGASPNQIVGFRHGRPALQVGEMVKSSCYDFIQGFVQDPNTIRGGWKWGWFSSSKLDRLPLPAQKFVTKMMVHKHPTEYLKPQLMIMDANADAFLAAPVGEPIQTATPAVTAIEAATASVNKMDEATLPPTPMGVRLNLKSEITSPPERDAMSSQMSFGSGMSTPITTPTDHLGDARNTPDVGRGSLSASPQRGGRGRKRGTGSTRGKGTGGRQKRTASRADLAPVLPPTTNYGTPAWQQHQQMQQVQQQQMTQAQAHQQREQQMHAAQQSQAQFSTHQQQSHATHPSQPPVQQTQQQQNPVMNECKVKIQNVLKNRIEMKNSSVAHAAGTTGFPGPGPNAPSTILSGSTGFGSDAGHAAQQPHHTSGQSDPSFGHGVGGASSTGHGGYHHSQQQEAHMSSSSEFFGGSQQQGQHPQGGRPGQFFSPEQQQQRDRMEHMQREMKVKEKMEHERQEQEERERREQMIRSEQMMQQQQARVGMPNPQGDSRMMQQQQHMQHQSSGFPSMPTQPPQPTQPTKKAAPKLAKLAMPTQGLQQQDIKPTITQQQQMEARNLQMEYNQQRMGQPAPSQMMPQQQQIGGLPQGYGMQQGQPPHMMGRMQMGQPQMMVPMGGGAMGHQTMGGTGMGHQMGGMMPPPSQQHMMGGTMAPPQYQQGYQGRPTPQQIQQQQQMQQQHMQQSGGYPHQHMPGGPGGGGYNM